MSISLNLLCSFGICELLFGVINDITGLELKHTFLEFVKIDEAIKDVESLGVFLFIISLVGL